MENKAASKPKYERIMEDLLVQILNKNFSYETSLCTEKQLSEKYEVSRITAKRAITELEHRGILYRKRGVGSFVTRNALNNLSNDIEPKEDSQMISLLLPFDITKGGLFDTVEVVNRSLNKNGYFMSIYTTDISLKKEKANIKLLLSQKISGLVYYPMRDKINLNLLNELVLTGVPVIIIDKSTDCPYIHNVVSDNFEGGRLLTEHLLSLGHKNIGFLTTAPLEETSTVRNRFGGYLHQLQAAGMVPNRQNLIYLPYEISEEELNQNEHFPLFNTLKQLHDYGITAIIAENDTVASVIKICCTQIGLRIPEDLSICGFDNTILSQNADITTINQNFPLIGEHVSKILLESIETPSAPIQKITAPVELVIRSSTGAPHP